MMPTLDFLFILEPHETDFRSPVKENDYLFASKNFPRKRDLHMPKFLGQDGNTEPVHVFSLEFRLNFFLKFQFKRPIWAEHAQLMFVIKFQSLHM